MWPRGLETCDCTLSTKKNFLANTFGGLNRAQSLNEQMQKYSVYDREQLHLLTLLQIGLCNMSRNL